MDKNYWVVRLGEAGKFADICKKENIVALGWSELDVDLSIYAHLDQPEFIQKLTDGLRGAIKEKGDRTLAIWARQLYKFAVLMKPGDVVVSPANHDSVRYIGIVRGGYRYDPGQEELPYRHRRDVDWVATVQKEDLSQQLRNSSGSIMTLFSVGGYSEELEGFIQDSLEIAPRRGIDGFDLKEFGMEAHLEDFIVENWNGIEAFKDYEIFQEDGEEVGQQYVTEIGRIDILARSKDKKEWLVIELKKGKTSDDVVGQVLRYIGWIQKNEAKSGEVVRGLVISGEEDIRLKYALHSLNHVAFMTYKVQFELKRVKD